MFFYIFCFFSFFFEGIQINIYIDSNFNCTPKCDGNITSPFSDIMEAFHFLEKEVAQEPESNFILNSLGNYEIKANDTSKIEELFKNVVSKVSFTSLNQEPNMISISLNSKNVIFIVNQVFSLVNIKFIFNENNDLANTNNQSLFTVQKNNASISIENCLFTGSSLTNARTAIFGETEALTNVNIRISNSSFSNLNQTNGLMSFASNSLNLMMEECFFEKIYAQQNHILNFSG